MDDYKKFLKTKLVSLNESGFDISESELNPLLFDFQKFCVKTALKKGKYALFEDCGLGKTFQQIEWGYRVAKHENKPVLIICPLAVALQTIEEGIKFGYDIKKITSGVNSSDNLYIVNYEQIENIDTSIFCGVVLDESSILKNFTGMYRNKLIELFRHTKYKLCCTATPSPNDIMELTNHAEFLNAMSRVECLATYFVHDGGDTSKWRLKKHCEQLFWDFVSQWAMMIDSPASIGFSKGDYILPELNYREHKIVTPKQDNGKLFNDTAVNSITFNSELRNSMELRLNEAIKIVSENPNDNFIIWVKHNAESDYLHKRLKDSMQVKGSDDVSFKEKCLMDFAHNKFRILITKSKIAQFGLNFQNCHNQIFTSLDFSFESLYQSIRRSYRFGQTEQVNIILITIDTMRNVIESIKEKQKQFINMQTKMSNATNRNYKISQNKTMDVEKLKPVVNEFYKMFHGDSCEILKTIESETIDLQIFSPPFADLYVYSDSVNDLGNSKTYDVFFEHFDFIVKELYRIQRPGRIVAVHCADLPIQKGKEGYIGFRDFSGHLIINFMKHGFIMHSPRITIWKDPVIEMQRTKALGLLHKQVKKDSTMSRVGNPDYILLFRKAGDNSSFVSNKSIPVELWQKWASPVWMDINQGNTLQRESAREFKDEKHICPLQLEVIKRLLILYSNENETVLSPFAGIGSEGYEAIMNNRKFVGIELKKSYYEQAVRNLNGAVRLKESESLKLL